MSFEISGKLEYVGPVETRGKNNNFTVREFVIEVPGKYPQKVKFQLTKDKCNLIDQFQPGNEIKVHFDIRGQVWKERVFNNLNAWKIEGQGYYQQAQQPAQQGYYPPQPSYGPPSQNYTQNQNPGYPPQGNTAYPGPNQGPGKGSEEDDLPF